MLALTLKPTLASVVVGVTPVVGYAPGWFFGAFFQKPGEHPSLPGTVVVLVVELVEDVDEDEDVSGTARLPVASMPATTNPAIATSGIPNSFAARRVRLLVYSSPRPFPFWAYRLARSALSKTEGREITSP